MSVAFTVFLNDLCAFVAVLDVCVLYVSLRSSVIPQIFGCVFMGNVVLSICRCSLVLHSTGVNNVHVVLPGLSMRLLSFLHVCNCYRYGCVFAGVYTCYCNVICV